MGDSVFNTEFQEKELASKIVAGLERISEAFKALLWDHAKKIGLSPIQIQILIFEAYHSEGLSGVSHLAKEFNLTKPTISDAVRVLEKKGLVIKEVSEKDHRRYNIRLTAEGARVVEETERFARPIKHELLKIDSGDLEAMFRAMGKLIYGLNKAGILDVQRTCYGCKFYENKDEKHFCSALNQELLDREIRLDCGEFESKVES